MEKLVYVGWRPDGASPAAFRDRLLGATARRLIAAGARGLAVAVADDRVVPGLRIARRDPAAVVSLWVDSHLDRAPFAAALAAVLAQPAGYLALESVPIPNTRHPAAAGERVPGLYTVAFLERPDGLAYDAWLARWQGEHTAVAIATQRTFLYVQNVLVRALTPDAPPWAAIVEEAFPAAAATDPLQFYAADTAEELGRAQRRMAASVARFIDLARFETIPMSAYVLARPCA